MAQAVLFLTIATSTGIAGPAVGAEMDCLKSEAALEYWRPIRERAASSDLPVNDLAVELLSCLGSPNPELRDRIGYELLTSWLRSERLDDETRRTLLARMSTMMGEPPQAIPGNQTFARSFSALVLSELMRSDSIRPFMNTADRQALLDQAIRSIEQENDYRGLDEVLGWIHPVAHMSDLLWRFALHPGTSEEQAESILDAVQTKVAPTIAFYSFNESDRLARVVTTIAERKLVAADKVVPWLKNFETPATIHKWSDAFATRAGMAELHNTKLFVRALSDQLEGADVDPRISAALTELVQGFTQLI
jgi:hypothetical protein